ncbi:hypothetical protein NT26_0366 [Pseudorhizobium banfieldiae]|uniref:Uncharacterized protein n=1 Tax=Pseudorhizobium banfieldiae TaxID=1125847 RepID=L0NAP3_9HYPH|nr:hypothetical protein NT26_0366 [Pseudorhizobium banfieldiae]
MVGHALVIAADARCWTRLTNGQGGGVTNMQSTGSAQAAIADAGTMRSAQDGASVSNQTRDVEDQADACGRACSNRQAADALSCSKPKRRTFHEAGERVDVLIAQFLLTKVAGQALVWWFQHRRGPLKSSQR